MDELERVETWRDPNMRVHLQGTALRQWGAKWEWGEQVRGAAAGMEFTRVEPDRVVEYALWFPDYNMRSTGRAHAPRPSGRRDPRHLEQLGRTWEAIRSSTTSPAMMDRMVGPDFRGAGSRT